jgi:hypothetical protein
MLLTSLESVLWIESLLFPRPYTAVVFPSATGVSNVSGVPAVVTVVYVPVVVGVPAVAGVSAVVNITSVDVVST